MLYEKFYVLNHGFVSLVDLMGTDTTIVQSARISFNQRETKDNAKLIKYLITHQHMGPFEQCVFRFNIKLPIFVMRQLVRHRCASINELSMRYVTAEPEFYIPNPTRMRRQKGKQGSGELIEYPLIVHEDMKEILNTAYKNYVYLLDQGLTKELARIVLPTAMYTEIFWKIDLRNLLHFIELRKSEDAQYEIRVYADAMEKCVEKYFPLTYMAWSEKNVSN